MSKKNIISRPAQGKTIEPQGTTSEKPIQPSTETVPTKPYQATVEDYVSSESEKIHPESRPDKADEPGSTSDNRPYPQSSSHLSVAANSRSSHTWSFSPDSDIDTVLKDSRKPSRPRQPMPHVHFRNRPSPKICHSSRSSGDSPQKQHDDCSRPRAEGNDKGKSPEMPPSVDAVWGQLFDLRWRPTERLHEVYRGLANHMIESFEPKNSTVLTINKLSRFYDRFECEHEIFPFADIFAGTRDAIVSLLNHMRCEYHLIPSTPGQPPSCPALTVNGFAEWMDRCVRAAPDQEAERLARAVDELCMEGKGFGDDGRHPARVPDVLPRHLFPPKADEALRGDMIMAYEAGKLKSCRDTPPSPDGRERRGLLVSSGEHPASDTPGPSPDHPRCQPLALADRNPASFDASRRYVPQNVLVTTVEEDDLPYRYPPPPSHGSQLAEQYVHRRRHRSPSPHDVARRRRRDSSPPPRRHHPSPPPSSSARGSRRHRNSIPGGGARPTSDLFRGVSTLQSSRYHGEQQQHRRHGRHHSPEERRYARGGRESDHGYYYPVSRSSDSRRSSMESGPRSPVDSRGSGSAWRR